MYMFSKLKIFQTSESLMLAFKKSCCAHVALLPMQFV
jgi:hypothetical protein